MIKDLKQFDGSRLTAKDSARIFSSKKKYLVRFEDNIHFTNNYLRFISDNYPEVENGLVEVYSLT